MVLRKQPPPSLDYLAKGNGHSEQPSSASPTSPTAKSASSSSPKRLTRPRRTRSSPQPRQVPPQGQVYSPDLNTSPAFDLMPIEQAQRSPPGSSPNDSQNPWADDWVDVSRQGVGQSDMGCTSAVSTEPQDSSPDDKAGKRVPPIVVAGTQRRMAANERQQTPGSNDDSEWDKSDQEPAQFQSNNPFLKAGLSEHNPWGDIRDSGAASFLQSDGSDRLSQSMPSRHFPSRS